MSCHGRAGMGESGQALLVHLLPAGPRSVSTACAVLVAGSVILLGAGPAAAHTEVLSTVPAAGATVSAPVEVVRLAFSRPVSPRQAQVLVAAPDGAELADGPAQVSDGSVSQRLARSATAGSYLVSYRVVADDGHPITGQLSFSMIPAAATQVAGIPSTEPGPAVPAPLQAARATGPVGGSGLVLALAAGLTAAAAALLIGAVRSGRRRQVRR